MKKSDIKNLKQKSAQDLVHYLAENQELLRTSRFDLAHGAVKNLSLIKQTKKTIARIKTFISLLNLKQKNRNHKKR